MESNHRHILSAAYILKMLRTFSRFNAALPLYYLPIVAGLSRLSPSCLTVIRSKFSEPRCVCRFAQARITVNLLVPDAGDLNSFSVGGLALPLPQALVPAIHTVTMPHPTFTTSA